MHFDAKNMLRGSFLLLLIIFLFQASPFLSGYRLTTDDIWMDSLFLNGWSDVWLNVKKAAFEQGRFTQFIVFPFAIPAAHYAGNYLFRIFYTSLYFSNFILFSMYVSLFLIRRVSYHFCIFMSLLIISLHPLDYYHLPPTSYPLHISLPIFLILYSRINIIKKQSNNNIIYYVISFFAVCFNEFSFSFYVALFLSEFFRDLLYNFSSENLMMNIKQRVIGYLYDIIVFLIYVMLYISFRISFPSKYVGNVPSAISNTFLLIKTIFGHAVSGTVFFSILRHKKTFIPFIRQLNYIDYIYIILLFCISFYLSYTSLKKLAHISFKKLDICNLLILSVLIILCTTTPLASVYKYQSWCSSLKNCAYIDSRLAFLGMGVLISVVFIFNLKKYRIIILSFLLALLAAVSFITNKIVEHSMNNYVMPWERVKNFKCISQKMPPNTPLSLIMDPEKRIPFPEGFDIKKYWAAHIAEYKTEQPCHYPYPYDFNVPEISSNTSMPIKKDSKYLFFLRDGWWPAEEWGAWSHATGATILLPISIKKIHDIIIDCSIIATPYNSTRYVKVLINNYEESFNLTNVNSNFVNIKIPEYLKNTSSNETYIKIIVENPQSPKDLGTGTDERKFGIGLKAITIH